MNKQLLTLGIVLTLGTVGCAGVGAQQGPSVSAQIGQERGIDDLWHHTEARPPRGLEAPLYARQHLDGLWDRSPDLSVEDEEASGVVHRRETSLFDTAIGQELAAPKAVRF